MVVEMRRGEKRKEGCIGPDKRSFMRAPLKREEEEERYEGMDCMHGSCAQ